MARLALGLAWVLGLAAAPVRAGGPPECIPGTLVNYTVTSAIAQFDVPANATELRVEMTGGSGGGTTPDLSDLASVGQGNHLGGAGVHVITIFQVEAPLALNVIAGGQGGDANEPGFGAGGGGGSFLFTPVGELYLAAAGGGGAGVTQNGQDGNFSADGGSGGGPTGGAGGTNGLGGEAGGEKSSNAGGGGGFLGDGGDGAGSFSGLGGHRISSPGDALGGDGSDSGGDGGFGGGGGGAGPSGGGGGGWSGGGTGFGQGVDGGGAGGTFVAPAGATFVMEPAAIPGDGSVAICVSEQAQGAPAEVPALSPLGLAALAALLALGAIVVLRRRGLGAAGVTLAMLFASGAGAQLTGVGLSSVRAQSIANQTIGSFPVQENDHFGWTLAAGDFNGDGRDEVATGIPYDDGPTTAIVTDGGALIVSQYFPGSGLVPAKFVRQSAGLDPPEAGDFFGTELVSCDFNNDGFDDLAVGISAEDGSEVNTGAVQTHYGRSGSFPGFGSEFFTQNTAGIPGNSEGFDSFGQSLACGDFDGDGYPDLVVGVPGEDLGFATNAGMIDILPGWSGGLASDFAYSIDQNTAGIDGDSELGDLFSYSLAAGNFDGDAYADLAIGVLFEDDSGAVQILFGSATGLDGARDLFWYDEAVGGTRETGDRFGEVLVTGDFDGDGYDDLAIGVPYEEDGTGGGTVNSGEVKVAYGAAGGFALARSQRFTQSAIPLAHETTQAGDLFGAALAAGDFNGDGFDDLAIGAPGEGIATADGQDGHVTVILGSPAGLTVSLARGFIAGSNGVPGNVGEHNKNFGSALAAGDFDGDGHDDLAIGVPYQNISGLGDVGAQTILYGSLFADGFETQDTAVWSAVGP
ncbi:MAG: FG-GAP repeat protein [Thermoanaerobaculia bacterium]